MTVVVVDTNFLIPLLDDQFDSARLTDGSLSTPEVRERVKHFVSTQDGEQGSIIIPAIVMAEFLRGAGEAGPRYVEIIERANLIRVVPFDLREAIELAELNRAAEANGSKRWPLDPSRNMAKVNCDRQIIATAITHRARLIISEDEDIHRLANPIPNITSRRISELPLPPEAAQRRLELHESSQSPSNPL